KVAETLAPEEFRGHPVEGLRADLRTPRAADVPAHTGRNQYLMLRIPKKYVLQADAQVVEPFERHVVLLVQDAIGAVETDAEIRRQALGEFRAEVGLLDRRGIGRGGRLDVRDGRQRQLVRDEGIVD